MGVATARPTSARYIADKYKFGFCANDADELIKSNKVNTVFIATRHNTHAQYVIESLKNNKNVFVEKPLCLFESELEEIKKTYEAGKGSLMIGFNRRFAPFTQKVKAFLGEELPKAITYRINAGQLPADHWVHDPEIGGGRIVGEACHFIDLAQHLAASPIKSVASTCLNDDSGLLDSMIINLEFHNKSIATISYFSNGSKQTSKEYLEVYSGNKTAIIDDFKVLSLFDSKTVRHTANQDKGYKLSLIHI